MNFWLSSCYLPGRRSEAKLEQTYLSQFSDVLRFRVSIRACEASVRQVRPAESQHTRDQNAHYSAVVTAAR